MIPNDLDGWNYELIEKLVKSGVFETDKFDFKEALPRELDKSVCAFANTEGGFLIFGIKDDRSLSHDKRIVGIDSKRDFPEQFGSRLINIEPHIYYDFKNPPISVPGNKNVIHVIKIPQSPERPHMANDGKFYYRTNKGNVQMNRQMLKESFLGEEQRRQKLRLLFIELLSNREQTESMIMAEEKIEKFYSLVTLDSSVLQTLLVETYPLIMLDKELVLLLMGIREKIKVINIELKIFYSKVSLPLYDPGKLFKTHNEFVNLRAIELLPLLDKSLRILQERYGLSDPFK